MTRTDSNLDVLKSPPKHPSSVHTLETTGKFATTDRLGAEFGHSLDQKQSRVIDLYSDLDYDPEHSRADRLKRCRTYGWYSRHKETGQVMIFRPSCKLRWCVHCGRARVSWITHSTSEWLKNLDRPKFVTFTLRHSSAELNWQVDCEYKAFRALRKHPDFKKYVQGGIWFFHIKKSETDYQWHNHLHCLFDSYYYPQHELKKAWSKVTGGSYIVDIRPIRSPKKAANDAARYAACPCNVTTLSDDELLEVYHSLHGRRICGTWGTAKGVPLKPPKLDHPEQWENVGSITAVKELRYQNAEARAIYDAEWFGTPLPAGITVTRIDNFMDNFESRFPVVFGDGYGP